MTMNDLEARELEEKYGSAISKVVAKDSNGNIIFDKEAIRHPKSWSDKAVYIFASKYLKQINGIMEQSVFQTVARLADSICTELEKRKTNDSKVGEFYSLLADILINQRAAFNSPVWFNLGVDKRGFLSACFISYIGDSMEEIMDNAKDEALIFKWGSGNGKSWGNVRSSYEKLSNGGMPSGPVSFMKGFDAFAGVIKSGGRHRRAAKMDILPVYHPDILKTSYGALGFIPMKIEEEKKAQALANAGWSTNFEDPHNCYSGSWYQNSNTAIGLTNDFMERVLNDEEFQTIAVTTQEPVHTYKAKEILMEIAKTVWEVADPGIFYETTINDWHTVPNSGPIRASNPCAEYVHLDNSSCNLSSLNLIKYLVLVKDNKQADSYQFDIKQFLSDVAIMIRSKECVVSLGDYPNAVIKQNSLDYRPLGLGYANLGALLMSLGIPYDSDLGRSLAAAITSLMGAQAQLTSAIMAEEYGAFKGYEANAEAMLKVIQKHTNQAEKLLDNLRNQTQIVPLLAHESPYWKLAAEIANLAHDTWIKAKNKGLKTGFRNSQVTLIAPTGTIRLIMDCDTGGIEPLDSLRTIKYLVEGHTMEFTPDCIERGLKSLGYAPGIVKRILKHIETKKTLKGCMELSNDHLPVFATALGSFNTISPEGHMKMMGAVQPFLSGSISKTVNLPNSYTVEDIYDAIISSWKLGLKCITFYRDGSKIIQPIRPDEKQDKIEESIATQKIPELKEINSIETKRKEAIRRRLPDNCTAKRVKIRVGGLKGYVIFGEYEDGSLGEVFVTVSKVGSTIQGILNQWATQVSISLQHGTPIKSIIDKERHSKYEPHGLTNHPNYRMASSITDFIGYIMDELYGSNKSADQKTENHTFASSESDDTDFEVEIESSDNNDNYMIACVNCGGLNPRTRCYCEHCGHNSGCS